MITALSAVLLISAGVQQTSPQPTSASKPSSARSARVSSSSPPFVLKVTGGILGTVEVQTKQVETKAILERLKADLKIPIHSSGLVAQHKADLSMQGSSVVQLLLALAPVVLADIEVGETPEDELWKGIHLIGYNEKEPERALRPSGFLIIAGTINQDGTISPPDPDADDKKASDAMLEEPKDTPMLAVVVKDGRVTLKSRKQPLVALLNEVAQRANVPFDLRGEADMFPFDIDLADMPLRDLPVALGRPGVRLLVRRNLGTGEEFVQGILAGEKRVATPRVR